MDEIALKTPTRGSISPTAVFMTPPNKDPCTSTGSTSSIRCRKRTSLSFSTPPKSYGCTANGNGCESQPFSTPTSLKPTLVSFPSTPEGHVRAKFPKVPRLESQHNPRCSAPERKFPFLMPRKSIGADYGHCGETASRRRLALPPLPNHTFRPVEVSDSESSMLSGSESFPVTPQVQDPKRTLPFLHFMCKESIHENRPVSLKRLSTQRRPSLLLIDW
jgi:hypothetical protein